MKFDKAAIRRGMTLYAVTDRSWLKAGETLPQAVEQAILGGATFVQLREKALEHDAFLALALEVQAVCRKYGVPFVINDDVQIALECGADGVHVGQSDMAAAKARALLGPDKIIGVSVHTVAEALEAKRRGADYLGVGTMFPTATKADAEAVTFDTLQAVCRESGLPVVAIGGIGAHNLLQLKNTGISGVAVVSAIFAAADIRGAAEEIRALLAGVCHGAARARVLTIAGSDCSGGAGIQADLKTMTAHGVYGMSAITALTAQNTTGVYGVLDVEPAFVAQQIDCVFSDIRPDAVKIGMVSRADIIEVIAERLHHHGAGNLVIDPVMVATSGSRLLSADAVETLVTKLLPMADIITPNIPEAEALWGHPIGGAADMERAAKAIFHQIGCAVLVKGGHDVSTANDLLYTDRGPCWIRGERIDNPNTHGTGCTLSSAIACGLAEGMPLEAAVRHAKAYISGALRAMLDLGQGSGPLDHMWNL